MPNNPYDQRLWQSSGDSPGFDWRWYTDQGNIDKGAAGSQIWDKFKSFKADRLGNMHFADYVRANPGMMDAYNQGIGIHPTGDHGAFISGDVSGPGKPSMWDWGKAHYEKHGISTGKKWTPQILKYDPANPGKPRYSTTLMTRRNTDTANNPQGLSSYNRDAFADYAQWHFETDGRLAGKFGSESGWYNSPAQQAIRASDAAQAQDVATQSSNQDVIESNQDLIDMEQQSQDIAKELAARSRRITSRGTVSAGGTGSFRARGLTTSENKRGGGTNQFRSTNPYFQATLNTGTGKRTGSKSTLNV